MITRPMLPTASTALSPSPKLKFSKFRAKTLSFLNKLHHRSLFFLETLASRLLAPAHLKATAATRPGPVYKVLGRNRPCRPPTPAGVHTHARLQTYSVAAGPRQRARAQTYPVCVLGHRIPGAQTQVSVYLKGISSHPRRRERWKILSVNSRIPPHFTNRLSGASAISAGAGRNSPAPSLSGPQPSRYGKALAITHGMGSGYAAGVAVEIGHLGAELCGDDFWHVQHFSIMGVTRGTKVCVCLLLQYLFQSCSRVCGGKQWRTCATRDYEPRPVWTSLPITL